MEFTANLQFYFHYIMFIEFTQFILLHNIRRFCAFIFMQFYIEFLVAINSMILPNLSNTTTH